MCEVAQKFTVNPLPETPLAQDIEIEGFFYLCIGFTVMNLDLTRNLDPLHGQVCRKHVFPTTHGNRIKGHYAKYDQENRFTV